MELHREDYDKIQKDSIIQVEYEPTASDSSKVIGGIVTNVKKTSAGGDTLTPSGNVDTLHERSDGTPVAYHFNLTLLVMTSVYDSRHLGDITGFRLVRQ